MRLLASQGVESRVTAPAQCSTGLVSGENTARGSSYHGHCLEGDGPGLSCSLRHPAPCHVFQEVGMPQVEEHQPVALDICSGQQAPGGW